MKYENETSNFGVEGLFRTPIYFAMLDNKDEIKEEFVAVANKLSFHDAPDSWGKPLKLTTKNFQENIIEINNMTAMRSAINQNLVNFLEILQLPFKLSEYRMTSWVTSADRGNYSPVHNHYDADISGVYYYETNEKDGDIFFLSPNLAMSNSIFRSFGENFHIKPAQGKMIMFPGWLQHGVTANTTDHNRKSLAFNIYFKR
ncbi:hypothetical protein G6678_09030 [Polynucleobacter paneuropaeus]|nr:hypothetical protein [Polynucleobacter paneuropaeus]QWD33549.1 hypothetical protein G6678_09030 [Polynucleobacter paneuropaeus]